MLQKRSLQQRRRVLLGRFHWIYGETHEAQTHLTEPQGKLEIFVAIQQNGDGTVVDKFDIHHRLKGAAMCWDVSFF